MKIIHLSYLLTSKLGALALVILVAATLTFALAVEWNPSKPMLGIVYYYDRDETATIKAELQRIKEVGFQIVYIPYVWAEPDTPTAIKTQVLYDTANQLGLKVFVREPDPNTLERYLGLYAKQIDYFQTINEADAALIKTWAVPSHLVSRSHQNAETIKKFNPNIKTVASFVTPITYPTLITEIAKHVDIIAIDIYEPIQLDTFPIQHQMMLTLSGKETIWIGEFGYATLDDQQQANFIQKGLTLFEKNAVEAIMIWQWKHDFSLTIKNRKAEQTIKNWVNYP